MKKENVNRHRTSGDDRSKKQQMEQLQSLFTILRHGGEDKIKEDRFRDDRRGVGLCARCRHRWKMRGRLGGLT